MGKLLSLAPENGNPIGNGPTWSSENSTYHQTGVNINVGCILSASAGGNLVAQGVNANVGGSTSLSAGGNMQLTTTLNGHINTFDFLNRYRDSGNLITVEQTIHRSDTDITYSGNTWSDLPPPAIPIESRKSGFKITRWGSGLMGIELHRQRAGDAARRSEPAVCAPSCCGA